MHYHFKASLDKVDSPTNVNYRIPEIDWKLRRAEIQFIKERISQSNQLSRGSFEFNNKVIDDMKNIVELVTITSPTIDSSGNYTIELPENYFYFVDCKAKCSKNNVSKNIRCFVRNNNEEILAFNSSSFDWEELNIIFLNKKIMLLTNGSFTISEVYLKYVKLPELAHNAEDYYGTVQVFGSDILSYYNTYSRIPKGLSVSISNIVAGNTYSVNGYITLNKEKLFGYRDPELPESTSEEIVTIAVNDTILNLIDKATQTQNQNKSN